MAYLNNAATTYPKPQSVTDALTAAWVSPPVTPYRSNDPAGRGDLFDRCRRNAGQLLGLADTERIFFTGGATDALNRLFGGLDLAGRPVVVTETEHNSVLRPLFNRPDRADNPVRVVPCDESGRVSAETVKEVLAGLPEEGLFVLNHCSNVTGAVQDVRAISEAVHRRRYRLLLDVSQSAGCLPVRGDEWEVDMLAFAGHKNLFGPLGTGGCYVRRDVPLRPLFYGGTGVDSHRLLYEDGDYEYEVGTQNALGIAGLNAGIEFVLRRGVDRIMEEGERHIRRIRRVLATLPNVRVYGDEAVCRGPLLSFNIERMNPEDVAYILENGYHVTLRAGLHCSPLIHQALGTESRGTLRVSLSCLTPPKDIDRFLEAVEEIASGTEAPAHALL